MSLKRIFEELTPEEIVESMLLPAKLTAKQRQEADKQLAEHRAKRRSKMSYEDNLKLEERKRKILEKFGEA